MDIWKELAMQHECSEPHTFLHVRPDMGAGQDPPDFLAININAKILLVVEAHAGEDISALLEKVNDYENRWLNKLKENEKFNACFEDGYRFQVHVYLREEVAQEFREALTMPMRDMIKVRTFEEIGYPWEWSD